MKQEIKKGQLFQTALAVRKSLPTGFCVPVVRKDGQFVVCHTPVTNGDTKDMLSILIKDGVEQIILLRACKIRVKEPEILTVPTEDLCLFKKNGGNYIALEQISREFGSTTRQYCKYSKMCQLESCPQTSAFLVLAIN